MNEWMNERTKNELINEFTNSATMCVCVCYSNKPQEAVVYSEFVTAKGCS